MLPLLKCPGSNSLLRSAMGSSRFQGAAGFSLRDPTSISAFILLRSIAQAKACGSLDSIPAAQAASRIG